MKLAVVGPAHSGKTTFANIFEHEYGFTRVAFADPVKYIAGRMLTTFAQELRSLLHDDDAAGETPLYTKDDMNAMKGHPSIRKLLQFVGTELGRDWHGPEDVWIRIFAQTVSDLERFGQSVICDDCRFVNEAEALKRTGFTVVRLVRMEDERRESIRQSIRAKNPELDDLGVERALTDILTHPSEVEQTQIKADVEYVADNLEDIEIIAILAREEFREARGYVKCDMNT